MNQISLFDGAEEFHNNKPLRMYTFTEESALHQYENELEKVRRDKQ